MIVTHLKKLLGSTAFVGAMAICGLGHAIAAGTPPDAATPPPATTTAAPATAPVAPAEPESWASSITLTGQLETGFVFNPSFPSQRNNFGQLLTGGANQPILNQATVTLQRLINADKPGDYETGFKFQAMYGSDARYVQPLGIFNHAINNQIQPDIVEANGSIHLPWLTEGGIDVKAGLYPTPLGNETIDPSTNAFYSQSYIFNFGLPFINTGVIATVHATSAIDIYGGFDTGANTTFGMGGDNNSAEAGILGLGLNLMDGNLKVLGLSHFGPENAAKLVPNANHYYRYFNDLIVTYKVNDALTLTTEGNWVHEQLNGADGYGATQYAAYTLSDTLTLNGRAEVWRDNQGFFVASFTQPHGFVQSQLGNPATMISAKPTTYGEITLGLTWKPAAPSPIAGLMIRPEIRYDASLNNSKPFNAGTNNGAFTMAIDAVLNF